MKLSQAQVDELVRITKDESTPTNERNRALETLKDAEVENKTLSTQAAPQAEKPKYKWVNGARVRVKE